MIVGAEIVDGEAIFFFFKIPRRRGAAAGLTPERVN
jgi:hypothetical protein